MQLRENVALAPYTTFAIGGPARWFAEASTEDDITEAVRFAGDRNLSLFVLGGGSNLLVADEGFSGLVLRIALKGIETAEEGASTLFHVAAGEDWDSFVAFTVDRGFAGIESLSGIPGSVGGTPVQNVGAYGQEVAQTIARVRAYDREQGRWVELTSPECEFEYRRSLFNSAGRDRYIIARVDFRLSKSSEVALRYPDLKRYFAHRTTPPTPAEVRDAVRQIRHGKGMLLVPGESDCRSAGSFFKNPVVPLAQLEFLSWGSGIEESEIPRFPASDGTVKVPAAWLLERAGFHKGYALGEAGISTRHTLALINRGQAQARDILALRDRIQETVESRFGIVLTPEPVWVG
jgi:UDP-N-acetylmuramate dehydrogenase